MEENNEGLGIAFVTIIFVAFILPSMIGLIWAPAITLWLKKKYIKNVIIIFFIVF